jgi:hypothetical protein
LKKRSLHFICKQLGFGFALADVGL